MRKYSKVVFILFAVVFLGCATGEDCEDYLCFTPPSPFQFELVDASTGENLFSNGIFEPGEIEIVTLEGRQDVDFSFIDENNLNIIRIHSIGWETESYALSISVASEEILELYVDAERMTEECCAFTRYSEVRIENADYEINGETGIYRILVASAN